MSRERTKDVLVFAAVMGLLAGAAACAGGQAATVPVADPRAADKNACGNHPGSACGAPSAPGSSTPGPSSSAAATPSPSASASPK